MATPSAATPSLFRSYLELCRASNLPTVWTNVLVAVVLSRATDRLPPALAAAAALTLFYLGGMVLNDILDLAEDSVRKPNRPLPSGRIPILDAMKFGALLFGGGLLLLLYCNAFALIAGIALIGTIYLYDRLHRLSPATVLLMAACRFLVFITAALAVARTVHWQVALAAAIQFSYIVTLTAVARWEKAQTREFKIPPIPWLLAGVSIVDGLVLAVLVHPAWFLAGLAGAILTRLFQTQVRGD